MSDLDVEEASILLRFAESILDRAQGTLPDAAVHETRRTILNVVGTALGASGAGETDALVNASRRLGSGDVLPPGRREALDPYSAACVTGFCAHFDDFDDTHLETVIHPGAATLGAWYALCAERDVEPGVALNAYAMGVESQLRLGLSMSPSHYDDGWHITGTCGPVGAAVACGVVLGLGRDALASAIGLALQMALGHREAFGTPIKPFHAGKAASNGLLAAKLAAGGARPREDLLEVSPGFFDAVSHHHVTDALAAEDIAARLVLLDNTYKPFPCGIVAHPAIEAAVELHEQVHGLEIADVEVECNPLVPELMGRMDCTNGLEARFCAIHGVAVGLLQGRAGLAEFSDEAADDPVVRSLRRKTRLVPAATRGRDSAVVTVKLSDDSTRHFEVDVVAGSRERPLSDEQLVAKFIALAEPVIGERSATVIEAVMSLGETTSAADLYDAVTGQL